jgi:uncharacterized Zn-finger protein
MWKEPGTKRKSLQPKKVGRPLKEFPQGKSKPVIKKDVKQEVQEETKKEEVVQDKTKKATSKIKVKPPKRLKSNPETQVNTGDTSLKFYRCVTCSFTTSSHLIIWKHRNQHILPYVCKICGERFSCRNALYAHYLEDHQAKPSQELVDWDDVKERIQNAESIEEFIV